jgi:hypothetical protein
MDLELELASALTTPRPIAIRHWWDTVAELGCLITRRPNPTLHHIKGGSVAEIGLHSGVALRGISDYLVIPLAAELHVMSGIAIDGSMGVRSWEARFGTQVNFMDQVCRQTGVNAWREAGVDRNPWRTCASSEWTPGSVAPSQ